MKIQIDLQKEDWKLFQAHIEKEIPKQQKSGASSFWINLLVWMVIAITFMLAFDSISDFHWPTAISIATFFILIIALFFYNLSKVRKSFEPLDNGVVCGTHKYIFTDKGIASKGRGYQSNHSWEIVKKIERTSGLIMIYLDKANAHVLPEYKLDDADGLHELLLDLHSNATSQSGQPMSSIGEDSQ